MEKIIKIDKNLYPIDCIYTTSYMFLDKAYIFLTLDNENLINIYIKLKNEKENIDLFIDEFKNQLLNYATQHSLNQNTLEIKKQLLNEILFHNNAEKIIENDNCINDEEISKLVKELDEEIDDSDELLIPWEKEKNKKNSKKKKNE
jgi:His-Xaa-Ser system protein HxsD